MRTSPKLPVPHGQHAAPHGQHAAPHGQPPASRGKHSAPHGQPPASHGQPPASHGKHSAPRGTAQQTQPVTSPRAPVDPVQPGRRTPRAPGSLGRSVRGLSGALAAGLCVLALTVLGVQFWMMGHGQQGPGFGFVAGQLAAALLGLVLQRVAEPRGDLRGGLACLGVYAIVFGTLALWWW